jgi:putative transposase
MVPRSRRPRRGKRRSYTTEQQRKALADAKKLGLTLAARKHGMPQTTIANWLSRGLPKRAAANRPAGTASGSTQRKDVRSSPRPSTAASAPAIASATAAKPRRAPAKKYTASQRSEIIEYAAAHDVTAAAKKFKVSRFSIYDWRRKVRLAADGTAPSPTAEPDAKSIEERRDQEILREWRTHPGLGPSQIRNQLRRKAIKVSLHTARRVMEDAGYRPPKVRREPHDKRFEAIRPNHMWHLDFVHRHINRASVFTLILIDDYSRFVVGHGTVIDAERADTVIETFIEATSRHGRPEIVMHDKGAAFWSWRGISRFTRLLTEMGIDPIVAEEKEWNGKVEVFNGNLHKELFDQHRFSDLAEMQRRLAAHLRWYNHERTHHALGGLLVPADRYFGRSDEVLARIESGAGRDLSDVVDLRPRTLDLFKVVAHDGVTEVWLMGRKVLDVPAVGEPSARRH